MKTGSIFRLLLLLVFTSTVLSNCTTSKHLEANQLLLSKNVFILNEKKSRSKNLHTLVKQKPNRQFLGLGPLYLGLYNLSNKESEEGYLKRIGEPPSILNYRLARKSGAQIAQYYKNNGYFDVDVHYKVQQKKHKAKVHYRITTGEPYTINSIKINTQGDSSIYDIVHSTLAKSLLKNNTTYTVNLLESTRNSIAESLQNRGYYKFNKEYIHFIADTSQQKKQVDLNLIVKKTENNIEGTLFQENHRVGSIAQIYVHLVGPNTPQDTSFVSGIHYIHAKGKPNFNLHRLKEKIVLFPGQAFNKSRISNIYQSLSSLNNFKKITIESSPLNATSEMDALRVDIRLIEGKQIAYSVEAEATTNPILNEGISGSASLSHYNIFKGAEHLQLTYKGSNNFNTIRENGFILNLSFPTLISPIKLSKVLNRNTKTKTIFRASFSEQQRPEFTRNSVSASYTYQWNRRKYYKHKLSLFNLSYVNFQGDSTDLSSISEFLIAKDYSNHLIPTTSYTLSYNNQNINKLQNHYFFRFHIESSGSILHSLARPLKFNKLRNEDGELILQDNGQPSYTLNFWSRENIFTQYIKSTFDYRYYWELDAKNSIVFRSFAGIIYAFGNVSQAPFHKKFTAGGANDLRGWQAYHRPTGMLAESDTLYTGGIKLLSSIEYRFNIVKKLKGALFIDAGNIWEIKDNNHKHELANFNVKTLSKEIAIDVGYGLRYDFQYFILRTDIGFPLREPWQSSKVQWTKLKHRLAQLNIGLSYPF